MLTISEDSLYLGSKFSCHASSLNIAVVRANLGFLSLVSRDLSTARLAFESAVKVRAAIISVLFLEIIVHSLLTRADSSSLHRRKAFC